MAVICQCNYKDKISDKMVQNFTKTKQDGYERKACEKYQKHSKYFFICSYPA